MEDGATKTVCLLTRINISIMLLQLSKINLQAAKFLEMPLFSYLFLTLLKLGGPCARTQVVFHINLQKKTFLKSNQRFSTTLIYMLTLKLKKSDILRTNVSALC